MIITSAIIKGGSGKTTTAAALAQYLVCQGKKALCIDLDPQANLTARLDGDTNKNGSLKLFRGASPEFCIQRTEQGIDLISGHLDLSAETSSKGSGRRLQEAIRPLNKKYSHIIIDTPPAAGEMVYNAIIASDVLMIPLCCNMDDLQGLVFISGIAEHLNPSMKMYSFITQYDRRTKLNQRFIELTKESSAENDIKYLGEIRRGIAIPESQALKENLFKYAKKSNPAQDYAAVFNIITKMKRR